MIKHAHLCALSYRFSFVMDIVRGMNYLHQHKLVHGRLKSSNCIIDDRWSVKIAGQYQIVPIYRLKMGIKGTVKYH